MIIGKFPFPHEDGVLFREGVLSVPEGTMILSGGLDLTGALCVWGATLPDAEKVDLPYMLIWTGESPPMWPFFGTHTYEDEKGVNLVYHIFLKRQKA